MTISSRTPEGQSGACPLCLARVTIEPSVLFGDATCPNCGQLLWFVQLPNNVMFFDELQERLSKDRILNTIATQLGVDVDSIPTNHNLLNALGADSLDTVELVMKIEEEFGK